jgi:hypothetical protein
MDDFFDDTPDVAIAFGIIEGAKLGGGLVVVGVRFELDEMTRE